MTLPLIHIRVGQLGGMVLTSSSRIRSFHKIFIQL